MRTVGRTDGQTDRRTKRQRDRQKKKDITKLIIVSHNFAYGPKYQLTQHVDRWEGTLISLSVRLLLPV